MSKPCCPSRQSNHTPAGISLRDWFAGLAMQGFASDGIDTNWSLHVIARNAYELADAMLVRRACSQPESGEPEEEDNFDADGRANAP